MKELKLSFDPKMTFVKVNDELLSSKIKLKFQAKQTTKEVASHIKALFKQPSIKIATTSHEAHLYIVPEDYTKQGIEEIEIYCKYCGVSVKRSFREMERKIQQINGNSPVEQDDLLKVSYPYLCTCQLNSRHGAFYRFNYRK